MSLNKNDAKPPGGQSCVVRFHLEGWRRRISGIQLMIGAALSIELLGQYSITDEGRESRGFDRNSIAVFSPRSRHDLPLVSIEQLTNTLSQMKRARQGGLRRKYVAVLPNLAKALPAEALNAVISCLTVSGISVRWLAPMGHCTRKCMIHDY